MPITNARNAAKQPAKRRFSYRPQRDFLRCLPIYFKGAQKVPKKRPSVNRQNSRQSKQIHRPFTIPFA
jgi:hypothetical protein